MKTVAYTQMNYVVARGAKIPFAALKIWGTSEKRNEPR